MATKYTDSCLAKAKENEPIFVLRAQDALAPVVVVFWIMLLLLAAAFGVASIEHRIDKLSEAFSLVLKMLRWPGRKLPD